MTNPDHNAFASEYGHGCNKREYFAALALQGLLANPDTPVIPVDVANNAIRYAGALIAALNSFDTTPQ